MGSIKPEWGLSLNTTDLELKANWFTNDSYSQGNMNVTYDLNGLGITGRKLFCLNSIRGASIRL